MDDTYPSDRVQCVHIGGKKERLSYVSPDILRCHRYTCMCTVRTFQWAPPLPFPPPLLLCYLRRRRRMMNATSDYPEKEGKEVNKKKKTKCKIIGQAQAVLRKYAYCVLCKILGNPIFFKKKTFRNV